MTGIFTEILNISISASLLIAACFLIRLIFRKMPKYIRCLMWLLVFIRLAVPFSIESDYSALPTKEYIVTAGVSEEADAVNDNDVEDVVMVDVHEQSEPVKSDVMSILSIVWMIGAACAMVYAFVSFILLKRRVGDATLLRDNIYQSEKIGTSFVLGIIRPRIYVPYGLSEINLDMVLKHENAHIKRRDHLIKPLGFLIATIHWFNPAVWFAYVLLCKDIEFACDEKVIKLIGFGMKKSYSQALLDMSVPRRFIAACPVAFGEIGTNERVKNVLKMKKTRIIIAAVAFCVCIALAVGFLTYPKKNKIDVAENTNTMEVVTQEDKEVITEAETEAVTEAETEAATEAGEVNSSETQENTEVEDLSTDIGDRVWPHNGTPIITRAFSEDHTAVDTVAGEGTPIIAAMGGTVIDAGFDQSEGNYVVIQGNDGYTYKYCHLQDGLSVSTGDSVSTAAQLGCMGNTGNSTGPHLHFEVKDPSGNFVDPMTLTY